MTLTIFLGTLLGGMALGVPIAFALLLVAVALMLHLDLFDAQIIAQNLLNGADSFPLMAVPFFMLAGEIMRAACRGASSTSPWPWSATSVAASATWRSSPPACSPRCPAQRSPTPRRWPPCWCR
jgi:hypothetical protein